MIDGDRMATSGLYQFDMLKLKWELISLYTVDSFRRIATECLVPMISQVSAATVASAAINRKHARKGLGGGWTGMRRREDGDLLRIPRWHRDE